MFQCSFLFPLIFCLGAVCAHIVQENGDETVLYGVVLNLRIGCDPDSTTVDCA